MGVESTNRRFGVLSNADLKREITGGSVGIFPFPYEKNGDLNGKIQIKSASLDITPSCLIMSVKTGRLLKIYEEQNALTIREAKTRYVFIEPRDTALVISREFLTVPNNICGSVNSRVSTVSAGLGHISTTIDPGWKGALLIAVSNPSAVRKKLYIQKEQTNDCPLATITFHYLSSPAVVEQISKKLPARVDILERYTLPQANWSKWDHFLRIMSVITHFRDYRLTTCVITDLKAAIQPKEWEAKLNKLEDAVLKEKVAIVRWKTNIMRWGRVLLYLLLSIIAYILAFAVICVISDSNNEKTFFQIILDIIQKKNPPNTNIAMISGITAVITFFRNAIRDARRD